MTFRPDVSVVVGVRDGAATGLRASLESILSQSGVSLELIVVDDGSDDDTPAILHDMAKADPRIVPLRQEPGGLTLALMRGCSVARAQTIARHDADDRSLPGRLAAQLELLDTGRELAFVSSWTRALGPADEVLWESRPPAEPERATRMLVEGELGPPGHGSVMMRRAAYERAGGYREHFYLGQDGDLWLRLAEQGGYAVVPRVLYEYRVSPHSLSSRRRGLQVEYGRLARACRAARLNGRSEGGILAEAAQLKQRLPSAAPDAPWRGPYFIGRCLTRRRDPRALRYLALALRLGPVQPRAWLALLLAIAAAPGWLARPRRGRGAWLGS